MVQRSFRAVARIGGLTFPAPPGANTTGRSLRAASSLIYQVLIRYDKKHVLLGQAEREALKNDGHLARVEALLDELSMKKLRVQEIKTLSPFAFPLWSEGDLFSLTFSSETTKDQILRMLELQQSEVQKNGFK